jgi:hypothetical protein
MMHDLILGSCDTFALSIAGKAVDIYVASVCITESDNKPYLPSFVPALAATERFLKERLNFLKYEQLFLGMSASDAYDVLRRGDLPDGAAVFDELRFADWGPSTDPYLCFLLPAWGSLVLSCAPLSGGPIASVDVLPYDLIRTLERAREAFSGMLPTAGPN